MKNIYLVIIGILAGMLISVSMLSAALNIKRAPDTNCFNFTIPARAEIYSESNSATNIVAEVRPDDVIYFCGDEK